jgi:hypothetical protein
VHLALPRTSVLVAVGQRENDRELISVAHFVKLIMVNQVVIPLVGYIVYPTVLQREE